MRFPRGCPSDSIPVNLKSRPLVVSSHDRDSPMNACSLDIGLLEKLVVVSNEANAEKVVHFHNINVVVLCSTWDVMSCTASLC